MSSVGTNHDIAVNDRAVVQRNSYSIFQFFDFPYFATHMDFGLVADFLIKDV